MEEEEALTIKTTIKGHLLKKLQPQHPASCPNVNDSYHLLTRAWGAGQNLPTEHWPQSPEPPPTHTQRFGIGQTGECPCNTGQQTADHILQT